MDSLLSGQHLELCVSERALASEQGQKQPQHRDRDKEPRHSHGTVPSAGTAPAVPDWHLMEPSLPQAPVPSGTSSVLSPCEVLKSSHHLEGQEQGHCHCRGHGKVAKPPQLTWRCPCSSARHSTAPPGFGTPLPTGRCFTHPLTHILWAFMAIYSLTVENSQQVFIT